MVLIVVVRRELAVSSAAAAAASMCTVVHVLSYVYCCTYSIKFGKSKEKKEMEEDMKINVLIS